MTNNSCKAITSSFFQLEQRAHCADCLDKLSWVDPDSFDMNVEEGVEKESGKCLWIESALTVDEEFHMDMNKLKSFGYSLFELMKQV